MDELTKLKLLIGKPFCIKDICIIKPLTLKQIIEIGWDKYQKYLSYLIADISDYDISDLELLDYTYWDILINSMCYGDKEYYNMIIEAMNIFLNQNIYYNRKTNLFYTEEGNRIDKDIFDEIRQILKWQNCILEDKILKSNSPSVIKMEKRLKKMRKKYALCNKNDILSFDDIISSLCCKHPSINLLNVENMVIYQIINQFKRINMIDDYQINIEALLHGANQDNDKKLKHWSNKIIND